MKKLLSDKEKHEKEMAEMKGKLKDAKQGTPLSVHRNLLKSKTKIDNSLFFLGEFVQVKDYGDVDWSYGRVTCLEPMKVKPEYGRISEFDQIRKYEHDFVLDEVVLMKNYGDDEWLHGRVACIEPIKVKGKWGKLEYDQIRKVGEKQSVEKKIDMTENTSEITEEENYVTQLGKEIVAFYQEQHDRAPTMEELEESMKKVLKSMRNGTAECDEEEDAWLERAKVFCKKWTESDIKEKFGSLFLKVIVDFSNGHPPVFIPKGTILKIYEVGSDPDGDFVVWVNSKQSLTEFELKLCTDYDPLQQKRNSKSSSADHWSCTACTFDNGQAAIQCAICFTPRFSKIDKCSSSSTSPDALALKSSKKNENEKVDVNRLIETFAREFYQAWSKNECRGLLKFYGEQCKAIYDGHVMHNRLQICSKLESFGKTTFDIDNLNMTIATMATGETNLLLVQIFSRVHIEKDNNSEMWCFMQTWNLLVGKNPEPCPIILLDMFKPVCQTSI